MVALVMSAWLMTAGMAHACANANRPATTMSRAEAAHAMRCVINGERRAHGLRAWRSSRRLSLAARRHARDMVRRRYFGHRSPERRHVLNRVARTGYFRRCMPCDVGENLHWGRAGGTRPAAVVRAWLGSPAHRYVLLHPTFTRVGIGIVRGSPSGRGRGALTTTLVAGGRRR